MKVKIGPYRNWIGPWQIAESIPFLNEDQQDRFGHWLSHTWVSKACDWIHSKQRRVVNVRIDPYDTWNMDHTLSLIILPMLKQLRDTKHGSPYVDDEDVPPHMRYSDPKTSEDGWDMGDNWVHYKWDWVLNEMIWTFEHLVKDDDLEIYTLDKDNYIEYNDRINNGLRLFGKYYRGLWD